MNIKLDPGNFIIGIKYKGKQIEPLDEQQYSSQREALKKACSIDFSPKIEWIQIDSKTISGDELIIDKYIFDSIYGKNTANIMTGLKRISTTYLYKKRPLLEKIKTLFKKTT